MRDKLKKYKQEHLLAQMGKLNESEQASLMKQVESIDFELLDQLYGLTKATAYSDESGELAPIASFDITADDNYALYKSKGNEAIKDGKLAVVLMAGGQGSRLGFDGPKGAFDIGLETGESLFELQAKSLLEVKEQADVYVKWYVMTSDTNHRETVAFFEENDYFGYAKDAVRFFQQGMLPAVSESGAIVMADESHIAFSPNGNGGIYLALESHGIMDEMKKDGVEWVFIYGVDNALVKVAEPAFFGYTIESGCSIGSKIVKKSYAEEKVGVVCFKNGKPAIVEYSELGKEMSELCDDDGSLTYDNANIVNHLIKLEMIDDLLKGNMEYHIAHKYVEGANMAADPERKPNAYKFETFIFDIFQYCEDMAVVEVQREEEFAPVKNKSGKDSPESARALVKAYRDKMMSK